ncbi:MAG: hypothetical protein J6Y01_01575 [Spirochaetales bacterium]|nr:hypothetical protein [Spirochaetales bacterium]
MSDITMAELNVIADSMTQEEIKSAMKIFRKKLKKTISKDKKKRMSKREKALNDLFDHARTLHLCSDGTKWTREELYER